MLDSPAEERFDRLTRLARRLVRAPIALVTLLDDDRQFFLSAQGLPEPLAHLRETPLHSSFCRRVVETGLPLVVADARADPCLRGNPAITDLGVVAYLAMPLVLPNNCVAGALCVIDGAPRQWTDEDQHALADLAGAVMTELAAGLRMRELDAANAALCESDARHRALFEVSPQVVWFADARGRVTYVNQHYTALAGLPPEQALGEGWLASLHPEDRERVRTAWFDAVNRGKTYEVELRIRRHPDGSHRWHLCRGAPVRDAAGRIERWIGIAIDIDDRRGAEQALRGLIEALGVAVYTTDAGGRLTFYNEAAADLWGWYPPLGEMLWGGALQLHAADGASIGHEECPMGVALRENRPVHGEEVVARRPDGTRVTFMAYPTPLRDGTGGLAGGVNVLVDITKRKAVEAALAESEARLQLALQAGRLAFWELDVATGLIVRGPSHDMIFGYVTPLSQWSLGAFLRHVVPEDRARAQRIYEELLESRTSAVLECRIRRADDGEVRWVEVHGQPHLGSEGRVVRLLGVVRDVTERKMTEARLRDKAARLRELQAELLHVSRLSAAGEMASALAHELNQPLTATVSAVKAARRMLAASPDQLAAQADIRDAIDLAAEQALRAGQIIRRLRDFVGREGEGDRRLEDLAKLAEEAGVLALVDAREHGIHVAFHFGARLPPVLVDGIQIQQVLVNLMRNALEAMAPAAPGEVAASPRRELVVTAAAASGEMVEVAIADTGPGVPPEHAGRLFDPFVSSKPGGMGLGLSICRSIIEGHGGRLWTEPNPGGGAVFRFTLPAAPSVPPEAGGP
ncbi:PAS domain S-box protein [Teichococcus oryzae]|uniref:PAS domain S-box protein n=1 Tax=Teichococcus oryzae TaxID=1608942 RepID=UPI0013755654|nr:PAS domain S-box protein [Pseudoroseomonas oryzae]